MAILSVFFSILAHCVPEYREKISVDELGSEILDFGHVAQKAEHVAQELGFVGEGLQAAHEQIHAAAVEEARTVLRRLVRHVPHRAPRDLHYLEQEGGGG